MTAQQLEDFARQIAVATVGQIAEGTPEQMNRSAEAWASRSRNLAKLWASKTPVSPEVASGLVSVETHEEISGPSLASPEAQEGLRRKAGRPPRMGDGGISNKRPH